MNPEMNLERQANADLDPGLGPHLLGPHLLGPHLLGPHLNEEQFAACAMGEEVDPATAAHLAAHLAACEACRAELAAFAVSVDSFNTSSMAWSEAQPARSLRPLVRSQRPQTAWAIASWALAGCLALATAVSLGTHPQGKSEQDAKGVAGTQTFAEAGDTAAQIERDNKLLLAVDQATSSRAASPLQEYGLAAPSVSPSQMQPATERE